jgi:hypothetical protein
MEVLLLVAIADAERVWVICAWRLFRRVHVLLHTLKVCACFKSTVFVYLFKSLTQQKQRPHIR